MSIVNNKARQTSIYNNYSSIWVRIGAAAKNSAFLWFLAFDVMGPFCVDVMYQDSLTPGVDIWVYSGRGLEVFTRMAQYEFISTGPVTVELAIK